MQVKPRFRARHVEIAVFQAYIILEAGNVHTQEKLKNFIALYYLK